MYLMLEGGLLLVLHGWGLCLFFSYFLNVTLLMRAHKKRYIVDPLKQPLMGKGADIGHIGTDI